MAPVPTPHASGESASDHPDAFRGAESRRLLSQHLMDWHEQPVADEDVVASLGEEALPAFRFAQARLEGRVRKVTLEPAFCHSADVALRAADLGYSSVAVQAALLHDVLEDTSKTVPDLARATDDLRARFAPAVTEAVELLTNRYQLLFQALHPKVRPDLPFEPRSARAYRAALDVLRWELPAETADRYAFEFERLARFLDQEADVTKGAYIVKRDKKFRLATWLERQVYRVYVDDLATRAAAQVSPAGGGPAVVALQVKIFDATDNIRTSEISNRLALYKLMNKAESLLDATLRAFGALDTQDLGAEATVPALARVLQLRLVDQLEARQRALRTHFAETRLEGLLGFLTEQAGRLAQKYGVPAERLSEIERLEDGLRSARR